MKKRKREKKSGKEKKKKKKKGKYQQRKPAKGHPSWALLRIEFPSSYLFLHEAMMTWYMKGYLNFKKFLLNIYCLVPFLTFIIPQGSIRGVERGLYWEFHICSLVLVYLHLGVYSFFYLVYVCCFFRRLSNCIAFRIRIWIVSRRQ